MARQSEREWRLRQRIPKDKWTLGDLLFMARHRERHYIETPALALSINANSIKKYERAGYPGGVYPKFPELVRLCRYYRVSADEAFASIENDQTGQGRGGKATDG